MVTKTQIDTVRSKMLENRFIINQSIDRTEAEAFNEIVDNGCRFLQKVYGYGTAPYIKHSRTKAFWNWYRLQWSACEDSFVQYMNKNSQKTPRSMVRGQYNQYMQFFCFEAERMDEAFKNYLKAKR